MLLLALAAAVALWRRAHPHSRCFARGAAKPRHGSCSPSPLSLNKGLLEAERYTPNPQYSALAAVGDALPAPALPRARLRLLNELGEGCFGKVFKGELLAAEGGGVMETVAVKVLKDAASAEAEQDFLREVETMSAFRHPNILRLVGVVERARAPPPLPPVADGECRPWMVFEYMPHGDLAEVLRNNSRTLWRPMPGLAPLTQVLGARPLPVRWMSPESIMYGRFTLESDVWSFGVVLWEIYSLGRQPYYGHSNEEVMKLIVQGIMLSCPEGCPAAVREVMRACWKTEPRDRLRFHEVHERLVKAEEEAAAAAATTAAAAEAAAAPTTPPSTSDDTATPASENALSPTGVESPPSLDDPCRAAGASTSSGAGGLPQPPGRVPLAQLRARAAELLDGENYLLPQQPPPQPREYLQPLPD
ncbi:Tyrosine-protein kinase transmembrane receptor Ror [Gryllus bimaculatus]|nr:Tyrosine-protein kinase transmembrane receptor Ror [Gryllus bimaculatus]